MSLRIGQKVVCIKSWHPAGLGYGDEVGPVAGKIYTIRDIGFLGAPIYPDLCVWLMEIINPRRKYKGGVNEPSFAARNFRPVVELKTDISIFTAMLKTKKIDA